MTSAAKIAALVALAAKAASATPSPAATPEAVPSPTKLAVTIRFEGRNVGDHWSKFAAAVLDQVTEPALDGHELTREVELGSRTSLCAVYEEELGLPGCSHEVRRIAERLNPGGPQRDRRIKVPNLAVHKVPSSKAFDTSNPNERLELENHRKKWGHIRFEAYRAGELVRDTVPAYEIWLELQPATADRLEKIFYSADVPYANFTRSKGTGEVYAHVGADKHAIDCRAGTASGKGCYAGMLGANYRPPKCSGDQCPIIVLVDKPIYKHPALEPALLTEAMVSDDGPLGDEQRCPYVAAFTQEHHATHLAGIMVGRDVPGSHFLGLAQDAKLYGVPWNDDQPALVRTIGRLQDNEPSTTGRMKVWVFASAFAYNQSVLDDGMLPNDEVRLREPSAARRIVDDHDLWVAAIGQPDEGEAPQLIERTKPMSPMNLGDQQNVIVVTACETCEGPDLRLWAGANRAPEDLVHVAAPGGHSVPGLATAYRYADSSGTSQAAAFVGGVAAAMMAEHPSRYNVGYRLKRRLQLTATPVIHPGDRIATGVVQPDLAICDPMRIWFEHSSPTSHGGERCAGNHEAVAGVQWCSALLDLNRLAEAEEEEMDVVRTNVVNRIVKVKPAGGRDRWVLYTFKETADKGSRTRVTKLGPAVAAAGANPPIARVTYEDGSVEVVRLGDVRDLLLPNPIQSEMARCD